jgi:hypothetical protein
VRGSDHFPIATKLSLALSNPTHILQDGHSGRVIRAIDWQRVLRIPYVESLERANTRLNECMHMANEGNLAQALDGLSEVVVNSAIEAGMQLRVRRKGQGRFRKPFFNEECQRFKKGVEESRSAIWVSICRGTATGTQISLICTVSKACLVVGPVARQVEYVSCQPPSILAVVPGITGRVTNPTTVT